jgi:single-stranded-DNA-specific exonuclease RecJ
VEGWLLVSREIVWQVRQADPGAVGIIRQELGVSRITAQVLVARGAANSIIARQRYQLSADILHSPWQLPGMKAAAQRIAEAIAKRERITVYGDYDVDGQTATALLVTVLRRLKAQVDYYIPSRTDEGYGLNAQAVTEIAHSGATLLITVDCGTTAVTEVALAHALGLDCIVTDHHEPAGEVAQAVALVNPKLAHSVYPWPHLAGVGVAYKLAVALAEHLNQPLQSEDLLDLVALGTVADVVPLLDENRWLVAAGLRKINEAPVPGIAALAAASQLSPGCIESSHLAFQMAPRLNAGGRIAHAMAGVEMLLSASMKEALPTAAKLDAENKTRQEIEEQILAEATVLASKQADAPLHLVVGENWHPGVIGIVASRLVEQYGRPTFVLSSADGVATASGRSVQGFHLTDALEKHADLLERFGGHAMAAGFTVRADRIDALRQALVAEAEATFAEGVPPTVVDIDAVVELTELDTRVLEELNQLGPFGFGNPAPVLGCYGVEPTYVKTVGKDNSVLRLSLPVARSQITAVGFRLGHLAAAISGPQDLAFTLMLNEWQGRKQLELRLRHLKGSERAIERVAHKAAAEVAATHDAAVADVSKSISVSVAGVTCCYNPSYKSYGQAYIQSLQQRDVRPFIWQQSEALPHDMPGLLKMAGDSRPPVVWLAQNAKAAIDATHDAPWALVLLAAPVGESWQTIVQRLQQMTSPHELHVLYPLEEHARAMTQVDADWPDRSLLVSVFVELRTRSRNKQPIAPQIIAERLGLSLAGAQRALAVFSELGLVDPKQGWTLLPQPTQKLDLHQSVSYNRYMAKRLADTQMLGSKDPQALFAQIVRLWR